jgi:radical SAM protein with 4Fe4S-binding SPASM domain
METLVEISSDALAWVDDFARQVRPHLFVREEDSLLILVPNQAYRLNATACEILGRTLRGESIAKVLGPRAADPAVRLDVHRFFCDIRSLVTGCLGEGDGRAAVERIAYKPPFNTLPVLSEIALTYRCNLRCGFCYAAAGEETAAQWPELGTREVLRLLEIIRRHAKVPSVSFTGGEPTLRPDLTELVRGAKALGLRVNLITNGTRVDAEGAGRLAAAGLDSAQVSVEGSRDLVHDRQTGVAGSFDRTIAAVEHLRRQGVAVHTNTTLSALNLEDAPSIVELAARLGLDRLSMNMTIPCGTAQETGDGLLVRYTDVGPVVLRCRAEARSRGLTFLWYSPTPYCIFNPVAERLGQKACAACDGLLSVAPDGSVFPCSSLMEPVGNLLRDPFDKIWRSAGARFWSEKKYLPDGCRACDAAELCAGACPIYWRAFGCGEIAPLGSREGGERTREDP